MMKRVFTVNIENNEAGWHVAITDETGRNVGNSIEGEPGVYEVTHTIGQELFGAITTSLLQQTDKC
jgi:hypothetical protein